MRQLFILVIALLATTAAAGVKNLASKSVISASGCYSDGYEAKYVADGKIPSAGGGGDERQAWCLPQEVAQGAWISFQWQAAVEVASIVYWGRTAFQDVENFSSCKVYVDDAAEAIASVELKKGKQGQVIDLGHKVRARKIRLVFPSNFGGSNPGASEIGIFSQSLSNEQLENYLNAPVALSAELLGRLAAGEFGFKTFLVVQRHPVNSTHVYTYHQEGLVPGGGLWVVDVSGGNVAMKKILDSPDGEILDANLHYDGRTILFSWKKTMAGHFQLYTIGSDGSGLKQLTEDASNNFNASFLPDGGIVFLSDRKPAFAYCWQTTTPILWRCNSQGGDQRRISSNYLNDFTPAVLASGKVIFSRWEYVDRPAIPIQSLWTINPDGTMLEGLFGNRSMAPATFMDAREIPGSKGKILCVLTSHNGPCRGAIGIIDPSKGGNVQEAIVNLTPEITIGRVDAGDGNSIRGPYLNPYPIDGRFYLVSKEGRIQLRDYDGDFCETLIEAGREGGFYNPQPIRSRKHEKLIASSVNPGLRADDGHWATIIMQDVYNGLGDSVARGSIKRLAIVQEIEKPVGVNPDLRAFGFQFPVVSCGATYAPKKIWGYATVFPDGSANFKVPAQKPIYFLPLDEKGMAVQRMRTFTHLMPGEVQSCIGCHADRNYAMAKTTDKSMHRPDAMIRKTQELEKPEWGVHGFSYPHLVQPVLDKHCVTCHGHDDPSAGLELTGDKTDFFNVSYENLARKGTSVQDKWMDGWISGEFKYSKYTSWISSHNGQEGNIRQIAPGRWGAKASLLANVVDSGHPDKDGKPRLDMSHSEKARIYAWIDLNCPYYGTSDSNYMALRGCRRQLPNDFTGLIKEVASRRCASCHENSGQDENWVFKQKDNFYIRLDNPQWNNFLMAPLAKSAGGSEKCGQAVFQDTHDPDYRKIMARFDALQKKLEQRPRFDMMKLEDQKARTQPGVCVQDAYVQSDN
ncbi:MAG: discoidin domain-containing protein [Phycisphaerae bacterium]|nr:discoidin domain-containing protein [Phycisphaerae bacterium]